MKHIPGKDRSAQDPKSRRSGFTESLITAFRQFVVRAVENSGMAVHAPDPRATVEFAETRTLSSYGTLGGKLVLLLYAIPFLVFGFQEGRHRGFGEALPWIVLFLAYMWHFYFIALPMKSVAVQGEFMLLNDLRRSCSVHHTEIKEIEGSWMNSIITVHFRNPTIFGTSIKFYPKGKRSLLSYWQSHPIIDMLERFRRGPEKSMSGQD